MVGQTKLLEKLNSFDINTLPKTIMLIGPKGSGKKTIAMDIARRLELEFIKIDDQVSNEVLSSYQQSPVKTLYLIDLINFTEKQQNQFLKFIEEPSKNAYIILTTESEIGVLPTVLNRCTKYHMEQYTIDELKSLNWFTKSLDETAFKVCKTPGQLLDIDAKMINDLNELCKRIINSIKKANYANTLSIAAKINYGEEYNKFDFDMFFNMLELVAFEDYRDNNNELSFIIYTFTNKFKQDLIGKNLVKETFMLNYLTQLWALTH